MKHVLIAAAIAGGTLWSGCHASAPATPPSSSALPAAGSGTLPLVYAGTLPCADCPGIRTELTLIGDPPAPQGGGTYTLKETYLGSRDGDRTFETRGRWLTLRGSADDRDATVYQLNPQPGGDPRYLQRIGDNVLRMLDRQQRPIVSSANYTLTRTGGGSPGGYAAIDPSTSEAREAASFATAEHAKSVKREITLTSIAGAERQIVKGVNYRLCLDVSVAGSPQRVQVVVYRDLNQVLSLTQWTPGSCDTR